MILNQANSKYMLVNFTDGYKFNIKQLAGDLFTGGLCSEMILTWQSNTELIVKGIKEDDYTAQTFRVSTSN